MIIQVRCFSTFALLLQVKFAVYLLYLHAIGYGTTAVFIIIYIFSSVLGVSSNLWLANWSDDVKKTNITEVGEDDTNWRLAIYAALGLGQGVLFAKNCFKIFSILISLPCVLISRSLSFFCLSTFNLKFSEI